MIIDFMSNSILIKAHRFLGYDLIKFKTTDQHTSNKIVWKYPKMGKKNIRRRHTELNAF